MVHGRGVDGSRSPHGQPTGGRSRGHLSTSARAGALGGDPGATAARPGGCSLSAAPSTLGGPGFRRPGRGRRLAATIATTIHDQFVRPPRSRGPPCQAGAGAGRAGLCGGPGAWRGWGWARVWLGPPSPLEISPGGVPWGSLPGLPPLRPSVWRDTHGMSHCGRLGAAVGWA